MVVFEAVLESTFWNALVLFCLGLLEGLNISIAVTAQRLFQQWG
jgi:hypothetical protein